MSDDDRAHAVDAVAAAVDGVARLYSTRSVAFGALRAVRGGDDGPLSTVREGARTEVIVSIGVTDPAPSAEVAHRVAQAVRRHLDDPDADVRVRVSRVHRDGEGR